jgi:serine/threonine protein kinase/tetratricopeptide (TPR) repeat protein
MTSNSGRAIEVFTEAVQLPIEERVAFLDRVCAGDEPLRRKIEALLKSNDRAGSFLEQPPAATISEGRGELAPGEKAGDRVDRYKLLQEIGEGGCGVVFVAEQQSPVLRRVALKVVKPGMDTKSVIARFEAERQALALMDHPNIAHVFDAGSTARGTPYFVMELVEGVKITDYCDRHSLPTSARLEVFVQVCDAIQHAHQKGIIHRDIKPSNILVTRGPDGKPVPKVIDFGIAKATVGLQLTDKTIFTACEMLIGTPAYMSPEQAALTKDVDTRTDIYSLGVLLYELLTGSTPFDTHELLKAGLDEVRRVIRSEEPVRPSTRLSSMLSADLVNVSRHHGAQALKLIREVRGDLDWIVMKALEKDPTRRYATANGLALDLKRHLSGEAVLACPPSRLYRFRKLVSRHKLGFAAFGIVIATLVAALSITTWSLAREKKAHREADLARIEADDQRNKALAEAARSNQVTEFMKEMLHGADPVFALGRDTTILREILDQTLKRLGLELTNQPAVQADLKATIGGVYAALGQENKGEPLIRDALAVYRKSPADAGQKLADALATLSLVHLRLRNYGEAEQEAREALGIETNRQAKATMRLVKLEAQLAWIIFRRDRIAEAEGIFREALATGQRLVGDESEQLLDTRAGLASALSLLGKLPEAEELLRKSLTIGKEKMGADHPYVANDKFRLALVLEREVEALDREGELNQAKALSRKLKLDEAEALDRQCLTVRRKLLSVDHPLLDEALTVLGLVVYREGKMREALETYGELLEIRRKRYGDQHRSVSEIVGAVAVLLVDVPDEARFEQLAREFPRAWFTRSELLAQRGLWSEALAAASRFLELQPGDHEAYHLTAPLLVRTEKRATYEELCKTIIIRFAGTNDPYAADRMAKDCLILPRAEADLRVPGELAETAVTLGRGDAQSLPYFQCCKALAELRLGHYEGAVASAQPATKGRSLHVRSAGCCNYSHGPIQAEPNG